MWCEVKATPIAQRQIAGLRGLRRKAFDAFVTVAADQGCRALAYRLTGDEPLPRLCVKHLRGNDRVIVAFRGTHRLGPARPPWVSKVVFADPVPEPMLDGRHVEAATDDQSSQVVLEVVEAAAGPRGKGCSQPSSRGKPSTPHGSS